MGLWRCSHLPDPVNGGPSLPSLPDPTGGVVAVEFVLYTENFRGRVDLALAKIERSSTKMIFIGGRGVCLQKSLIFAGL